MKHVFSTLLLSSALTIGFSSASFADDKSSKPAAAEKTEQAYTITANSGGQVQRAFHGQHIDTLPDEESSTKAIDDPNRIVCQRVAQIGSRLRKRKVCATKKEWDLMKTQTVNTVRQMQVTRATTD